MMNKALQWAERHGKAELSRPYFECMPQNEEELTRIAQVSDNGAFEIVEYATLSTGDAVAFARWILDTFEKR
jgi:hypothetical protein